ncbi:hypothetical protein [Methylobacterium nigriterrae]|uniref:hypothetical protein n=1 Tax=Methylobacterium nigriterrae TaxID=3127512 RepID=UPI003014184F
MTTPSPSCPHMRALMTLLSTGASASAGGDGRLILNLLMLEMHAETCGAPEPTLRSIATARWAAELSGAGLRACRAADGSAGSTPHFSGWWD